MTRRSLTGGAATAEPGGIPAGALAPVGGPRGRRARPASWASAIWPLVALAAVPMQLAVLQRAYCIDHGWTDTNQFWRACFSDLPTQARSGGLLSGLAAYVEGVAHVDHPVVTGSVMALVGDLVGRGSLVAQQRAFFLWWTLLSTVLLMLVVWLTGASRPRHVVWAAQVALSPLVITTVLVSSDIVGVALVAAAVWAWARRHLVVCGVLLGAATMARTYPALVLVALAVLGLRAGRLRSVRTVALAALATAAVVALPFLVGNPGALTRAYAVWWRSAAGFGSPWILPQLAHHPLPVGVVTSLAVVGVIGAVAAGLVLALGAARRPSLAEVAVVMVGIALLTGKALPIQSSLWLLPLAALAGVRWRDQLIWAGTEVTAYITVWLYAGGLSKPDRGLPPAWYAFFVLVRLAGIGYLVWRVWHTATSRPAHEPDPARPADPDRDEVVDELAGDFTDAPDRLVATYT